MSVFTLTWRILPKLVFKPLILVNRKSFVYRGSLKALKSFLGFPANSVYLFSSTFATG